MIITDQDDIVLLSRARRMAASGAGAELRREAKLTQADVGRYCQVSPQAIAAWETGRARPGGQPGVQYAQLLIRLERDLGEIDEP